MLPKCVTGQAIRPKHCITVLFSSQAWSALSDQKVHAYANGRRCLTNQCNVIDVHCGSYHLANSSLILHQLKPAQACPSAHALPHMSGSAMSRADDAAPIEMFTVGDPVQIGAATVSMQWVVSTETTQHIISVTNHRDTDHRVFDIKRVRCPLWLKHLAGITVADAADDAVDRAFKSIMVDVRSGINDARGRRTKHCRLVSKDGSVQTSTVIVHIEGSTLSVVNDLQTTKILASRNYFDVDDDDGHGVDCFPTKHII